MNLKKDKVMSLLNESLMDIQNEINKIRIGETAIDSISQLQKIENAFRIMIEEINKKERIGKSQSFGLWRFVIDEWPFNSTLRKKIAEAELLYEKYIKKMKYLGINCK